MDNLKKPLTGMLEEFRLALEEEILEAKKNSSAAAIPMLSGDKIRSSQDEYIYRFRIDTSINSPADSPVTIVLGQNKKYDAIIVSFDEPYIVLSTKKDIGDHIGYARLETDLSMLMERLISRIEENSDKPNALGEKMLNVNNFCGDPERLLTLPKLITERQREAIESALGRDLTYIWGPPGTGKTQTIGEIIEEFFRRDKTVLLVSHTNTAVDGAINKACEELSNDLHTFPILRLGQISSNDLRERYPEVTLKYQQKVLSENLVNNLNLKIFERDEAQKQVRIAEVTINKCDSILDAINSQQKIDADLKKLYQHEGEKDALENDLLELESELSQLHEKGKIVFKHNDLLEERDSKRKQYEQQKQHVFKLESELQVKNIRIKEIDEEVIYSKKKEDLEARRELLFTPEKQKGIIKEIEIAINNKQNDLNQLLKQEDELKILLNKANNTNLFLKTIYRIPDSAKLIKQIEIVADEKSEMANQLASLHLLKENKVKEYHEILSIYAELATFPEIHSVEQLLEMGHQTQIEIFRLNDLLIDQKNHLEQGQHEMVKADSAFNEFVKSINFDLHQVTNDINKLKQTIEDKTFELQKIDNAMSVILQAQNSIQYQKGNYQDGVKKLQEKLDSLEISITDAKAEIGCSNIEEVMEQRDVEDRRRQNLFEMIGVIKKEIEEIQIKLAEIENFIIANAKIIGTTLTKAYLSDEINKRKFDAVILDEASMASIPSLWASAYLSNDKIIIVGDFKQLPPIALSNEEFAQKWIAQDIFYHSGVEQQCSPLYKGNLNANVIILNQQYRMRRQIADLANYYYWHMVESPNESPDTKNFDWYKGIGEKSPISIIDTKNLHAWVTSVTKGGTSSRINYLSATLCVALAKMLVEDLIGSQNKSNIKVLIICPYRPHAKRVDQLIEQEGISDWVRAGTIHSFQGSEADVVIFDLVVDEPHWRVGLFNPDNNQSNERLFNVAITRAKHKLFFIGNMDYCLKNSNKNSELRRLLEVITSDKKIEKFDGKELFPALYPNFMKYVMGKVVQPDERICLTQELFYYYLYLDIEKANKRIIIYSPFISNNRLGEVVGYLKHAVTSGVNVHVITKAPEERGKREEASYDAAIKYLKANNINVIYKKGMHEKLIFIDDDIVWSGSLNALSFSDTQEVMERRKNKIIFDDYIKLMHIESLIERMLGEENLCPICGDQLIIAEGANEPFYYTCINKGCFTMSIGQKYPKDGKLTCEKCGGELSFSMKNQPRWICENNKKHFIKVRQSHLRLPRMVDKIPNSELETVELYFNKTEEENV